MEPEHLAQHDISALARDVEETSGQGRKTSLNDWIKAFLVVELNRRARQSISAPPYLTLDLLQNELRYYVGRHLVFDFLYRLGLYRA